MLSGCSSWKKFEAKHWAQNGDCAEVCDAHSGLYGMSSAYRVNDRVCRCWDPFTAELVCGKMPEVKCNVPTEVKVACDPDCHQLAEKIRRQKRIKKLWKEIARREKELRR